jgi:hypothetical protein
LSENGEYAFGALKNKDFLPVEKAVESVDNSLKNILYK